MPKLKPKPAVAETEAQLVADTLAAMKLTGKNMEAILKVVAGYREELGVCRKIFEQLKPHIAEKAIENSMYPATGYEEKGPFRVTYAIDRMMERIDLRLKG